MNERDFEFWLQTTYVSERGAPLDPRSISSTLSNCRRVEKHFGDLDAHYDRDRCESLLGKLHGSGIRVQGIAEKLESSLRSGVVLYAKFRARAPLSNASRPSIAPAPAAASTGPRPASRPPSRPGSSTEWPKWPQPDDVAILRLAEVTAPYVRMLHPDIVRAVVEDNRRNMDRWRTGLRSRGVDPATYLWDGCAVAFPGVRRYSGSKEIAEFRGHGTASAAPPGALRLDDNDFPKHLWSFVFRGKPFQKFGPEGYALAHLADHKDHGNRRSGEFDGPATGASSWHGLYTSASNAAYTPVALLKPTDFSAPLRNLILRRAEALYGSFCSLLPPGWAVRRADDPRWRLEAFTWSEPVGDVASARSFLEFRDRTMTSLLRAESMPEAST